MIRLRANATRVECSPSNANGEPWPSCVPTPSATQTATHEGPEEYPESASDRKLPPQQFKLRSAPAPATVGRAVQRAAAIDSLLKSVRFEIEEDLAEARPSEHSISQAMDIARQLALSFHRQPWVDVAGFVTGDGRPAVLAHSMETGRRITFYSDGQQIRAIKAAVGGKPDWFEPEELEEVRSSLSWITRVD